MGGELLTFAEVASHFNVGLSTVYDWRNRYGLKPVDPEARPLRFDMDDLVLRLPSRTARVAARAANGRREKKAPRQKSLKGLALDLEDLAHISRRRDVTFDDWLRVCRGRFKSWPVSQATARRVYERWKQMVRRVGVRFVLVNLNGEPWTPGDKLFEVASLRFDWGSTLRWTKRVLD